MGTSAAGLVHIEKRRWEEETLGPAQARSPERRAEFTASSGVPLPPLHTPADAGGDYVRDLGFPGEFPFTRGIHPTMYRGRLWTMRQYAGFGTADQTNARFRALLARGQTGLSVAFDLPTQMGYDSDHPLAQGEVGRSGVAIDSLEDMERLFAEIPLERVSTSMTINATAAILLCLYVAVARKQGADLAKLSGTVQNDVLKEFIARGTYIYPVAPSLRIVTDLFRWSGSHLPAWNVISISGYHIREAGSTAAQEIAFTLANAVAYLEAARAAGLSADEFAPRVSFFFNAHNLFLEEVAKFRAARRLWARLVRDRFGATNPRAMMLRFHAQTGGSTLTAQQPDNNVARVALQALAAVLGGAQSLHTNGRDEALALPTEAAAVTALRTQQVIAFESGVADVVDPLAGSYAIESLTDRLEAEARAYLERIDRMGGAVKAIEDGFVQREIADAAYATQRRIESGDQVVVGVNRYSEGQGEAAPSIPIHRLDEAAVEAQVERLRALRARRDRARVEAALADVTAAARGADNLIPPILAAVEAMATLGELSDAMRVVFGEHRDRPLLDVRNLRTVFDTAQGEVAAVDGVSFHIRRGEVLCLVGESGCGKTMTAYSLMRLVSPPGRIAGGEVRLDGRDLLSLPESEMRAVRGNRISIVFQEPMTSLNPVLTIGFQIAEAVMLHQGKRKKEALKVAVEMMRLVAIPDPEQRSREYPHQLSGGMRQRVMISIALACRPALLIADEPTTALDVTIQAQILDLLRDLRRRMNLSVLLITHDLGIVAGIADRVAVMYAGRIVEEAPVRELFRAPLHPYTRGLMRSLPGPRAAEAGARRRLVAIEGSVPDMAALPSGCRFHPRCPDRMVHCRESIPALAVVQPPHKAACFLHHTRVLVDEEAAPEVRR